MHNCYGLSTAGLSVLAFTNDGNSAAESDDDATVSLTSATLPLAALGVVSVHWPATESWTG